MQRKSRDLRLDGPSMDADMDACTNAPGPLRSIPRGRQEILHSLNLSALRVGHARLSVDVEELPVDHWSTKLSFEAKYDLTSLGISKHAFQDCCRLLAQMTAHVFCPWRIASL